MTNSTVPIVSFKSIANHHPETIINLHNAARDWGLFYLEDTEISSALSEKVFEMSGRFFQLSHEQKNQLNFNHRDDFRGYLAVGEELTKGKPDMKESLEFAQNGECPVDATSQSFFRLYGENPWPKEALVPEFRSVLEQYIETIQTLAQQLMETLIYALGTTTASHDLQWSLPLYFRTRLMHYCQVGNLKKGSIRVGDHTDLAFFNLLRIDAPGLEVKNASGNWLEVNPRPNTLVVILGDLCEWLTQANYRAGVHRVRQVTSEGERTSMPFFFYPDLQTVLPLTDDSMPLEIRGKCVGDILFQRLVSIYPHMEAISKQEYAKAKQSQENINAL